MVGAFLAGFSLGPWVFGWLVEVTGSYVVGWGVVAASFAAAALLSLGLGEPAVPAAAGIEGTVIE